MTPPACGACDNDRDLERTPAGWWCPVCAKTTQFAAGLPVRRLGAVDVNHVDGNGDDTPGDPPRFSPLRSAP
jgi:hypothetical protein